jgi:hypothetical protein
MFSKTLIAALLASAAVATPIVACTPPTYQLRTFPTGAGSIYRGLSITLCDNGLLCVYKNETGKRRYISMYRWINKLTVTQPMPLLHSHSVKEL